MHALRSIFSKRERSIRAMKHESPFSIDLTSIDVRIHTFLNKTPTNNFPFESFPLGKCLLIVLSVKVTYIRNWRLAGVAYSQGLALDDSRAHLVIESDPSIMRKAFNIIVTHKILQVNNNFFKLHVNVYVNR